MPGYFMRTVAMAISLLVIVGCSTERESVERQLGVRLLSDSEIPKGFETYTFFLSLSREYAGATTVETVEKLKERFDSFGVDIGENNAAVFFQNVRGGFDVSRSKDLADILAKRHSDLRLQYNASPLLVILNHHPEDPPAANDVAVAMSFSNISTKKVIEGLNFIEEGIRRQEIFEKELGFYETWLEVKTWFESVESSDIKDIVIEIIRSIG